MPDNSKQDGLILVDGHVHFYSQFNLETVLNSSLENFKRNRSGKRNNYPWAAALFLTETEVEIGFSLIKKLASEKKRFPSPEHGPWSFEKTGEDLSLLVRKNNGEGFFVIGGKQIKAEGNLEVLALGTDQSFESGRSIQELIRAIGDKGALPVIPWGAGKWLGDRGKLIKQLILDQEGPGFFLGDTRNRPVFWPKSAIFKIGAEKGLKTLPGSDPLPLNSHATSPGSYGFWLTGSIPYDHPFTQIKRLLLDPGVPLVPYGKREKTFRFVRDQFFLRAKAGK